ncbi:hypothetical protein MNBD_PLANCTO03-1721, partial [hydrothermal vent metagenome]
MAAELMRRYTPLDKSGTLKLMRI